MAPSEQDVRAQFNSFYGAGRFDKGAFEAALAPDHKLSVAGHDFVAGGKDLKAHHFYTDVAEPIMKAIDQNKSLRYEIILVIISSDSPYVAVVAKTTGTTKNGKPLVNEAVSIVKYGSDNKIAEFTLFPDTQHLHEHIVAHN